MRTSQLSRIHIKGVQPALRGLVAAAILRGRRECGWVDADLATRKLERTRGQDRRVPASDQRRVEAASGCVRAVRQVRKMPAGLQVREPLCRKVRDVPGGAEQASSGGEVVVRTVDDQVETKRLENCRLAVADRVSPQPKLLSRGSDRATRRNESGSLTLLL